MTFLTTVASNSGILPSEYAGLITKPLTEKALPFQEALATTISTEAHQIILPTLETDASAAWVNEGGEIDEDEPVLSETKITFGKVAALVPVSREMANDSSPKALEIVGASVARSIIAEVNKSFLGNLAAPAPKGLESVTEVLAVASTLPALENLDIFTHATMALEERGRMASGWILNPADAAKLATLKDGTGSNRRLIETVDSINGLPAYRHPNVPKGTAWALDANFIFTGLREDLDIAISEHTYFTSDRIAIRASARIGYGFTDPKAIAQVQLYAPTGD